MSYDDDTDDFDEPVSCVKCRRTHELQDSRFCSHWKGLCPRCWRDHEIECGRGA